MKSKILFTLAAFIAAVMALSVCAYAEGEPEIYVSSAECAVGESVDITLSLKNVKDYTAGDINIQYNPNMLYLSAVTESKDMKSDSEINMMYTEIVPQDRVDDNGEKVSVFNLALLHLNQFPARLNDCDVITLTFNAIGGGECPLVVNVSSFTINEVETAPIIHSGLVKINGKEAATWDYAAHVEGDVVFTDSQYPYPPVKVQNANNAKSADSGENETKIGGGKIIIIVVIAVAAVGAVAAAVVISGKKKYVD